MFDSRGFELSIGDEVLVVQHKNQVEIAGTIITCRDHQPFNTITIGTVVDLKSGLLDNICTVLIGVAQLKIKGNSEVGWFDRIFLLPQKGTE
jgi:hypothetical protein